jgi:hypothetical protein
MRLETRKTCHSFPHSSAEAKFADSFVFEKVHVGQKRTELDNPGKCDEKLPIADIVHSL